MMMPELEIWDYSVMKTWIILLGCRFKTIHSMVILISVICLSFQLKLQSTIATVIQFILK